MNDNEKEALNGVINILNRAILEIDETNRELYRAINYVNGVLKPFGYEVRIDFQNVELAQNYVDLVNHLVDKELEKCDPLSTESIMLQMVRNTNEQIVGAITETKEMLEIEQQNKRPDYL